MRGREERNLDQAKGQHRRDKRYGVRDCDEPAGAAQEHEVDSEAERARGVIAAGERTQFGAAEETIGEHARSRLRRASHKLSTGRRPSSQPMSPKDRNTLQ